MNEQIKNTLININSRMSRNIKMSALAIIIMAGFVSSTFHHYYQGQVLGKPYPYTTFLFTPADRFNDFFVAFTVKDLNPYFNEIVPSAQFPLVNVIDYLITLLPLKVSLAIFITFISTAFISITHIILWGEKAPLIRGLHITLPIAFLTYPFLFTVDRGNLEILLFIFLLLFMYFYIRENYALSAVFLAVAIAMKLFPVVLVVAYLPKKKYGELAISIGIAAILTMGSLALFKGGFVANFNFLLHGSNFSFATLVSFVGADNLVQRGVSLFTFFKIIFIETGLLEKVNMPQFLSTYVKVAALTFLPLAAYVVFIEKILWRQIALLVFSMLLLPQISADYKLMHVYLPMYLFIISAHRSRLDIFYLLIFGLLMIPKDYAYFPKTLSDAGVNDISISVMMNIILMILMSMLIVVEGLRDSLFERFGRLSKSEI